MADALHFESLCAVSQRIRSREVSSVELTRAQLERIERLEPQLRSFALVTADAALAAADRAEREIATGTWRGPLHGVPIAVKDLCNTRGVRTAAGTRVLRDHVPDHSATVVERLEAAGAVLLGKLQLTEGAYGWHHPEVDPPRNPWDATRWTGVSSSGSGVATAAGLCFGSLGSDTGGSIRFPSSCCNLVGLKPTYGRVSRFGVFDLAASLDHIGPMTRTVEDAAVMLQVIAGHDPRDPTSLRAPVPDLSAGLGRGVAGLRIGVDERANAKGVDPRVTAIARAAAERFGELGARIERVTLPDPEALIASWVQTTAVECARAHAATFPARADEYGPPLRALLELAAGVTGAQYAQAERERELFKARLADLMETVDCLLVPGLPTTPPPADGLPEAAASGLPDGAEVAPVLQFTAPFDYSGSPTLSLPGGFSEEGPVGFQLVGRPLEEDLLLRAGAAYQTVTDWHARHPSLEA